MATSLNTTVTAREFGYGVVQTLIKKITFADYATTVTVGKIPAYSHVIGGGVHVVTGFNSSGTDLVDMGYIGGSTVVAAYASAISMAAVGLIAFDDLATTTNIMQTVETTITATPTQSVADATAGEGYIIVQYVTQYLRTS